MKKQIFLLGAALVSALHLSAASNADEVLTESRTSKPYSFIQITGEMDVKIVQDETPAVQLEGNKFQLENTIALLKNDTLFIFQNNTRRRDAHTQITLHVKELVGLEVTGKSNVDCSGMINTDYLTIRAMEGAIIKLDVRALKVNSKATGCSVISLSGNTFAYHAVTDGCGRIDTLRLDVMELRYPETKLCVKC